MDFSEPLGDANWNLDDGGVGDEERAAEFTLGDSRCEGFLDNVCYCKSVLLCDVELRKMFCSFLFLLYYSTCLWFRIFFFQLINWQHNNNMICSFVDNARQQ